MCFCGLLVPDKFMITFAVNLQACMRAVLCARVWVFCFFSPFPLSGLGFAGQWHASLRLAPYSPGAAGIPDEWYGRRRRRPQTRRGAFPFKHDLMTTDFFSEGRPEDRTRGWQPGTPEDRFGEKKPVTATDSPGQYRTQRPCRGSWFGASLREQLALDGYYLTCPQVGPVPVITSTELKGKSSIVFWLFKIIIPFNLGGSKMITMVQKVPRCA